MNKDDLCIGVSLQLWEDTLAANNSAINTMKAQAETIDRLTHENERQKGRMCVNCGRVFPAEYDRNQTPSDCTSLDACNIDMTLQEAVQHWRQKAHDLLEENKRLFNKICRALKEAKL